LIRSWSFAAGPADGTGLQDLVPKISRSQNCNRPVCWPLRLWGDPLQLPSAAAVTARGGPGRRNPAPAPRLVPAIWRCHGWNQRRVPRLITSRHGKNEERPTLKENPRQNRSHSYIAKLCYTLTRSLEFPIFPQLVFPGAHE
jgi:hypothetical protein